MTKIEKIQLADEIIKALSNQPQNLRLIVQIDEQFSQPKPITRPKPVVFENSELLKFSLFTIRDATKRLNQFDYYIDNIRGTEFEVVNVTNASAYIVDFRPFTKKASCTCLDFSNRARICKHIAFVHDSVVSVA